jgi:hypothetical protein
MPSCFDHNTTYFWQEGKANLNDCLRISFEAAKRHDVTKLVIFTAIGEGVKTAHRDFISQEQYAHMEIVAVTFAHGHPHPQDISNEDAEWMIRNKIPLIRAHLPFDPIRAQYQEHGILGQDFTLLGNVLSIFGGSMNLAVQAVLMACDAGVVRKGEHVISLTSDTSILVRSAPTSHLLTDFIVREIFCKAVFFDISKKETTSQPAATPKVIEASTPKLIEG